MANLIKMAAMNFEIFSHISCEAVLLEEAWCNNSLKLIVFIFSALLVYVRISSPVKFESSSFNWNGFIWLIPWVVFLGEKFTEVQRLMYGYCFETPYDSTDVPQSRDLVCIWNGADKGQSYCLSRFALCLMDCSRRVSSCRHYWRTFTDSHPGLVQGVAPGWSWKAWFGKAAIDTYERCSPIVATVFEGTPVCYLQYPRYGSWHFGTLAQAENEIIMNAVRALVSVARNAQKSVSVVLQAFQDAAILL